MLAKLLSLTKMLAVLYIIRSTFSCFFLFFLLLLFLLLLATFLWLLQIELVAAAVVVEKSFLFILPLCYVPGKSKSFLLPANL